MGETLKNLDLVDIGHIEYAKTLLDYIKKGWDAEENESDVGFGFYLISPRGHIFLDTRLSLNLCNICEDSEIRGCSGIHSEEDLREEHIAKHLYGIICKLMRPII